MTTTRTAVALSAFLCLSLNAWAQAEDEYAVEEWTLELDEETPKPQHKEYKNAAYLQFSPSRYEVGAPSRVHFSEFTVGYNRLFQVVQEHPYFVEAGAGIRFSWTAEALKARLISFRIPVSVLYKFYFRKDKDYAIAPFAGVALRAIAMARGHSQQESTNLLCNAGWSSFQIGWQAGVRFYLKRYYAGISYARDFRDTSKIPGIRECSVQLGYCL